MIVELNRSNRGFLFSFSVVVVVVVVIVVAVIPFYLSTMEVPDKVLLCNNKSENLERGLLIFQGVAWQDVYEGTYYPAVSLYKNATVINIIHFVILLGYFELTLE